MKKWAAFSVVVIGVVVLAWAPSVFGAISGSPTSYGWWYEANLGVAVAPPPPPSVPANGMYIENGVDGPAAISALSFAVPSGAAVGPLVLHVAGTPEMSQPPIACPLVSPSFASTQEGQWSTRPTYDCQKAELTGQVDSAKTTVTFDVASLSAQGHLAVAILAGGTGDAVAFAEPGPDTLTLTAAGTGPPPATTSNQSPPSPSNVGSPATALGAGSTSINAFAQAPSTIEPPATPPVLKPATSGSLPAVGTARSKVPVSGSGGHLVSAPPIGSSSSSAASLAARILGLVVIGLVLVAWTEGYGILGGRIKSLASPLTAYRTSRSGPPSKAAPDAMVVALQSQKNST